MQKMVMPAMTTTERILLRQRARQSLCRASGAFHAAVEETFADWPYTPSERKVALFMLKGIANSESAALRQTPPGTIKAQTTAVFRGGA